MVLRESLPFGADLRDVFFVRWGSTTGVVQGVSVDLPPSPAAPIFQGADWTGNVAVTAGNSGIQLSNCEVYAEYGFVTEDGSPNIGKSGTEWYPTGTDNSPNGPGWATGNPTKGLIKGVNFNSLLGDLTKLREFVVSQLPADIGCSVPNEIKQTTLTENYDGCDSNNDGLVVIDVNTGGDDWKCEDADWIIQGSGSKFIVFRFTGEANLLFSNCAILLGNGGIGGGSSSKFVRNLGAVLVKYENEDSDQVFNGNNVVLNGVGWWDLTRIGANSNHQTQIHCSDCQGCSQFIGHSIDFRRVYWNRCSLGGWCGSLNSWIPSDVPLHDLAKLGVPPCSPCSG